jgi:hypothetical protein
LGNGDIDRLRFEHRAGGDADAKKDDSNFTPIRKDIERFVCASNLGL